MSANKNKGTKWASLQLVEDPPAPEVTVSQPITGPLSEKVPRTITLHGNVSACPLRGLLGLEGLGVVVLVV